MDKLGEQFIKDEDQALYLMWVKAVNSTLAKYNNTCLSCYESKTYYLKYWFVKSYTPEKAAERLDTLKHLRKNRCLCEEKGLKQL